MAEVGNCVKVSYRDTTAEVSLTSLRLRSTKGWLCFHHSGRARASLWWPRWGPPRSKHNAPSQRSRGPTVIRSTSPSGPEEHRLSKCKLKLVAFHQSGCSSCWRRSCHWGVQMKWDWCCQRAPGPGWWFHRSDAGTGPIFYLGKEKQIVVGEQTCLSFLNGHFEGTILRSNKHFQPFEVCIWNYTHHNDNKSKIID